MSRVSICGLYGDTQKDLGIFQLYLKFFNEQWRNKVITRSRASDIHYKFNLGLYHCYHYYVLGVDLAHIKREDMQHVVTFMKEVEKHLLYFAFCPLAIINDLCLKKDKSNIHSCLTD